MSERPVVAPTFRFGAWAVLGARCLLGAVFLFMGVEKVWHPSDFLAALHQYHLIGNHLVLNLTAVVLPWMEIVCGLFLLTGIAVRGSSLVALSLLVVFSLAISQRALGVQQANSLPFCAIRFDCGCGSGEVLVCRKLIENATLIALSIFVLAGPLDRWRFRHHLITRSAA